MVLREGTDDNPVSSFAGGEALRFGEELGREIKFGVVGFCGGFVGEWREAMDMGMSDDRVESCH